MAIIAPYTSCGVVVLLLHLITTMPCLVQSYYYQGAPPPPPFHPHFVPVPFPYSAGNYRHTTSVVNIPVHQERLIIVRKPGHQHHPPHPPYDDSHSSHGQGESRNPSSRPDARPFQNYHREPRHYTPYFEDVAFLLDPKFAEQSVWLDQFPDFL